MNLPENKIKDIPFKVYKGCYLLYDENNELVYVGVSNNIAVRLWQHELSSKKWTSVKYIEEINYIEALKIENYLIDKYKPKYNKVCGKLKWQMIQYKKAFDINKIVAPSGW